MRLPPTARPSDVFVNAQGSTVPQEYALEARKNPDNIPAMADTAQELSDLKKEALVRQYVLVIDRSGSMNTRDGLGTRWDSARKAVENMVDTVFQVCAFFDLEATAFVASCSVSAIRATS